MTRKRMVFALRDEAGRWLAGRSGWSPDLLNASLYSSYPAVTAVLAIFGGDAVKVHAVRVEVTLRTVGK